MAKWKQLESSSLQGISICFMSEVRCCLGGVWNVSTYLPMSHTTISGYFHCDTDTERQSENTFWYFLIACGINFESHVNSWSAIKNKNMGNNEWSTSNQCDWIEDELDLEGGGSVKAKHFIAWNREHLNMTNWSEANFPICTIAGWCGVRIVWLKRIRMLHLDVRIRTESIVGLSIFIIHINFAINSY